MIPSDIDCAQFQSDVSPDQPQSDHRPDPESKSNPAAPPDPWGICLNYAERGVGEEVKKWKDEMANLLIFATLFSSVAATFSIESYHNVEQDPAEISVLLLKSILALQLNPTSPQAQTNLLMDLNPTIPISASAKRINLYYFLSLVLSLSVVMVGIVCLQWLREYEQDPGKVSNPLRVQFGIRSMRHEGLESWHVSTVLNVLPLILLLSLFLFFAGIIELLLGIDRTAMVAVSTVIGITAIFLVVTTVVPTLLTFRIYSVGRLHEYTQCPWKSPQAWTFYQIIGVPLHFMASAIAAPRDGSLARTNAIALPNWSAYDQLLLKHTGAIALARGIHWVGEMYLQEKHFAQALYRCIQDSSIHQSLRDILDWKKDIRRVYTFHPKVQGLPIKTFEEEKDRESHMKNITVFQTLAHLAEKIDPRRPPPVLLKQRLDLFFKINKFYRDKNIDCPVVSDMDERVLDFPDTRRALLDCILDLMLDDEAGINKSHLEAVNDIFDFETNEHNPDIQLFDRALEALNDWIDRNSSEQAENEHPASPPPRFFGSLLGRARNMGSLLPITRNRGKQGGGEEQPLSGTLLLERARQVKNHVIFLRSVVCKRR